MAALGRHEHRHLAELLGRGQRLGGGVLREVRTVHLGQQQDGHQITPASFLSLSTSSSTEATLTPA